VHAQTHTHCLSFFGELLLFVQFGGSENANKGIFELALMLKDIN